MAVEVVDSSEKIILYGGGGFDFDGDDIVGLMIKKIDFMSFRIAKEGKVGSFSLIHSMFHDFAYDEVFK